MYLGRCSPWRKLQRQENPNILEAQPLPSRLHVNSPAEELSAVCQRLPRGKAPGDDGLPYEFYVAFWERLAPRLLAVLNARVPQHLNGRAAAEHALRAHHAAL